jgi:small subunit ribosomal protein S1
MEDDFATLFEASLKARRFRQGDTVDGTVAGIGTDVVFVDVGGKGEATIDLAEVKDEDGTVEVAVGDRIQAVVVSTDGGIVLSRRLARNAATSRQLEDAYHARLPVQGKVEKDVKGGYEVRVGHARGFCPFSQMDVLRGEPAMYVGHVYEFRIAEFKNGGRDLVLSRRALLEEAQKADAAKVRATLVPGAIVTGRVASVREFGAFVDLGGGVQGLLHISEMGWSRVSDPSHVVKPGQEITVKVLAVDNGEQKQKISLGLKQLAEDPWVRVADTYAVGQVRKGRVTRLTDFGAFVELEPGIEGLAHASTFPPTGRREAWADEVPVGKTAVFEIVAIDQEKKRLGLAPVPEGSSRARALEGDAGGARPEAPSAGLGSLADKLRGALGPRGD